MEAKSDQEELALMDENSDRISSLHDSIPCHILSFLPANCVARTSVLSKRWLRLQISAPNLYFKEFLSIRKERFTNFVDNILLRRDKSCSIVKFDLECNYACDESHTHAWTSAAVRAQVQNLKLYTRHIGISNLPSSCLFTCNSLVELNLHFGFLLRFQESFCFPKMKSMHLQKFHCCGNIFRHLLKSQNLEKLCLKSCRIDNNSSPISSQAYQDLTTGSHLGAFFNLNEVVLELAYSCSDKNRRLAHRCRCLSKFMTRIPNVKELRLSRTSIMILKSEIFAWDHDWPMFGNLKRLDIE